MMMSWENVEDPIDPTDVLTRIDDQDLLDYAGEKLNLVLTEEDLEDGIPENYMEDGLNHVICDFADVLSRLQKQITKHHTERILAGKESLKSINQKLVEQYSNENISISDDDLNNGLGQDCYSARYLINVGETIKKFEEEMEAKKKLDKETQEIVEGTTEEPVYLTGKSAYGLQKGTKTKITKENIQMGPPPDPFISTKRQKLNQVTSSQPSASKLVSNARKQGRPFSSYSIDQNQFTEADSPSPIISSVKSLAPSVNLPPSEQTETTTNTISKYVPILPKPPVQQGVPLSTQFEISETVRNEPSPRLILRKSPSAKGDVVYHIVHPGEKSSSKTTNSSGNSHFTLATHSVTTTPSSSTSGGRMNPELVQVPPPLKNNFVLKGTMSNGLSQLSNKSKVNTELSASVEKEKADQVAKMRESMKQAHISEKARNPTRKTVGGVEHLVCRTCAKAFPAGCDILYRNHMITKHSIELDDKTVLSSKVDSDEWNKCLKCGVMMTLSQLNEHYNECLPEVPFEKAFEKIVSTKSVATPITCGVCLKSYDTRISLRQHLTGFHKDFGSKVLVDPHFRCARCLRKFDSSVEVTIHSSQCTTTKPEEDTILELAKGLLFCEVCEHNHESIEETQNCYLSNGLIRCILCLHTVISKGNFFNHMKVYHDRKPDEKSMHCQFCSGGTPFALRYLFEHIVEVHYNKSLVAAAKGIFPIPKKPPLPPLISLSNPNCVIEKRVKKTLNQPAEPPAAVQSSQIPAGIVINTSRVIMPSATTASALVNANRIRLVHPSRPPLIVARSPQSVTSTSQSSPAPIRFIRTANGGTYQLIPSNQQGRYCLPPGLRLVSPSILANNNNNTRPTSSVNILRPATLSSSSSPIIMTSSAATTSVSPAGGNMLIPNVRGATTRLPNGTILFRPVLTANTTGSPSPRIPIMLRSVSTTSGAVTLRPIAPMQSQAMSSPAIVKTASATIQSPKSSAAVQDETLAPAIQKTKATIQVAQGQTGMTDPIPTSTAQVQPTTRVPPTAMYRIKTPTTTTASPTTTTVQIPTVTTQQVRNSKPPTTYPMHSGTIRGNSPSSRTPAPVHVQVGFAPVSVRERDPGTIRLRTPSSVQMQAGVGAPRQMAYRSRVPTVSQADGSRFRAPSSNNPVGSGSRSYSRSSMTVPTNHKSTSTQNDNEGESSSSTSASGSDSILGF